MYLLLLKILTTTQKPYSLAPDGIFCFICEIKKEVKTYMAVDYNMSMKTLVHLTKFSEADVAYDLS